MKAGENIEVFDSTHEMWQAYRVTDSEEPCQKNGKWLFSAQSIGTLQNECQMIVESERIRTAQRQQYHQPPLF